MAEKCQRRDFNVGNERDLNDPTSPIPRRETYEDTDKSTKRRKDYSLYQELDLHVVIAGTDRESNTDLAPSFRYRDEHDIHDADTTDQQAGRGKGAERCRQEPMVLVSVLKIFSELTT
jgi:hypothetical protein